MKKLILFFIAALVTVMPLTGCKTTGQPEMQIVETNPDYIEVSDKAEVFDKGYFQTIGTGTGTNQSMALLAARSLAQARLVEIIHGVEVERLALVKEGKLDQDSLQVHSEGVVRFAYVHAQQYASESRTARVSLRLDLKKGGLGDLVGELVNDDVK